MVVDTVSLAENTRAKSDAFAVQHSLPKFEYVLHPRTTGFTFIVERLRKGRPPRSLYNESARYKKTKP